MDPRAFPAADLHRDGRRNTTRKDGGFCRYKRRGGSRTCSRNPSAGSRPTRPWISWRHCTPRRCERSGKRWQPSPRAVRRRAPKNEGAFAIPNFAWYGSPPAPIPVTRRAWGKFQSPGVYATTITQPDFFRRYLLEQLRPLVSEYGASIQVAVSDQEMPYPYVFDRGDELAGSNVSSAELARHFPTPLLSAVGDEVADGLWTYNETQARPLALFDAVRVDYSLRRLMHYTGTDWRSIQPWILLTNYQRYVDQFVRWGLNELADPASPYDQLLAPGGIVARRGDDPTQAADRIGAAPWFQYQMPAYHLGARGRAGRGDNRQHRCRPVQRKRPSPIIWRFCARTAG